MNLQQAFVIHDQFTEKLFKQECKHKKYKNKGEEGRDYGSMVDYLIGM